MSADFDPNEQMGVLLGSLGARLPENGVKALREYLDVGEEGECIDLLLAYLEKLQVTVSRTEAVGLRSIADFYRSVDTHDYDYLDRMDEIVGSLTVVDSMDDPAQ